MSSMISITEECGMEISLSITSLIFSQDGMELYFEGTGVQGHAVLMVGDVKIRANYTSTPDGYEIADQHTGKTYWLLDCLEAFKQFARHVFDTQQFSDWD